MLIVETIARIRREHFIKARRSRSPRSPRLRNPGQLRRGERYRQTSSFQGVKIGRRCRVKFQRRLTHWAGPKTFRNAFAPTHEGYLDLPAHRQSHGCPASAWPTGGSQLSGLGGSQKRKCPRLQGMPVLPSRADISHPMSKKWFPSVLRPHLRRLEEDQSASPSSG